MKTYTKVFSDKQDWKNIWNMIIRGCRHKREHRLSIGGLLDTAQGNRWELYSLSQYNNIKYTLKLTRGISNQPFTSKLLYIFISSASTLRTRNHETSNMSQMSHIRLWFTGVRKFVRKEKCKNESDSPYPIKTLCSKTPQNKLYWKFIKAIKAVFRRKAFHFLKTHFDLGVLIHSTWQMAEFIKQL